MTTKPSHEELERRVQALETKNTQLEKNLHEARSLSEEVMTYMSEGLVVTDTRTSIMFINKSLSEMLGYLPEEIIGKDWLDLVPADQQSIAKEAEAKRSQGYTDRYEIVLHRKNSDKFPVLIGAGPRFDEQSGQYIGSLGVVTDITDRKRAETYREMEREILQILNEPGDLRESIQLILAALKTWTGVDAAGLRLQEGEDFPYFVQDGFSKDFLLTENTLLERDKDGGMCRDKDGNVRLECTCGLVISGKTDPSNPLFTQGGSSWTNDSVHLLDLPSDQDPRLHPRNNCIHKGYASVALIPVRIQGQIYSRETCVRHGFSSMAQVPVRTSDRIVGLIQLNDKRKDRFTLETIEILESIAAHVGSALIRKQAEEDLEKSLSLIDATMSSLEEGLLVVNMEGKVIRHNRAFLDLWEIPPELESSSDEMLLEHVASRLADPETFLSKVRQLYDAPEESSFDEVPFVDGRVFERFSQPLWQGRQITGRIWCFRNITHRKQVEEELKASERRARLQRAALSDLAINQAFAKGEVSDVLRLITRNLTQTLAVSRASIWVLSEDNLKLSCLMLYESDKDVFSSGTELQALGMPRYFKAIMQENRINAEDAQNDPRTSELTDAYLKPLGITSMLDGGIIIEGRVKGVVCTEHIGPVRKWFPDEEAFISTISALVAQLMANTERKQAEESLRKSEERYRTILNEMSEGYYEVDLAGNYTFFNEAFHTLFGYAKNEMLGTNYCCYAAEETEAKQLYKVFNKLFKTKVPVQNLVWDIIRKDGERRTLQYFSAVAKNSEDIPIGFRGIVRDITLNKRAEEEREKLQTQLLQAQKMESVGHLAGGVAHDFNNMLGVIMGHAELALQKARNKQDPCSNMEKIQTAARRSADLTKQLLAFARKQIIEPKLLDLNHTVEKMLSMLRRLIGEDIDLSWVPARKLWPVKMDPTQVDQILANLCVNARDAIDGVGKLTIETGMKTFDPAYCADHPGFIPGDFVMLAVSDNGCGMDKNTLDNVFEPFFTTKEVGKGTGLGLATIYGIVKQNNGFINVYSEPGQGSTFKIYLPRQHSSAEETASAAHSERSIPTGNETILLVEDEPEILEMTGTMLEQKGYSVLSAASPNTAIQIARAGTDRIHLLITDVIMPEMNGRDLAEQVRKLFPEIELLFMSGYTANVIAHHGVLDDGVAFLQKPFSIKELAEKVREVLDMALDKA